MSRMFYLTVLGGLVGWVGIVLLLGIKKTLLLVAGCTALVMVFSVSWNNGSTMAVVCDL